MGKIYKVPNRIVYLYGWVFCILFLVWFFTNNIYVAIFTGILGVIFSIIMVVKPRIMPRMKLLFSEKVPDIFFNLYQRVFGSIFAVTSVFILFNYRISNSLEIGVLCIFVFGGMLIIDILWLIYFRKSQTSAAKSYVIFSSIVCLIFCVLGTAMIILNSPFAISTILLLPTVIGIAVVCGIFTLWSKKQKSNLQTADNTV